MTDKREIVNLLASTLKNVSSAIDLNPVFNKIKTQAELHSLDFRSDEEEDYNILFTISELSLRRH